MDLPTTLAALAEDPRVDVDLAVVALHLARDEYPDLVVDDCLARIDALADAYRARCSGPLTSRVETLSRLLFVEEGFAGNTTDYYDPRNSYLNEVLDRRLGIPISLSVLAIAVAARAGLRVVGVALPGHFVAKAIEGATEVLFDPFHGGKLLSPEGCAALVEEMTGEPLAVERLPLHAAPPGLVVLRMLSNLKAVYLHRGDFARAARVIERVRLLIPSDRQQDRDLGVALLRSGSAGRAIDLFHDYLREVPDADDRPAVRKLIDDARGEVARWN